LILWEIITIVATRCHILKLQCTNFDFGWGSHWKSLQLSPDPLVGFKGPTSRREKGGKGRKREEAWKEGEGP